MGGKDALYHNNCYFLKNFLVDISILSTSNGVVKTESVCCPFTGRVLCDKSESEMRTDLSECKVESKNRGLGTHEVIRRRREVKRRTLAERRYYNSTDRKEGAMVRKVSLISWT